MRSITSAAGRLFDDLGAADVSRDATLVGVPIWGVATETTLGAAVLLAAVLVTSETTISSSSTKFASCLGVAAFLAPGTAHSPFGSIVTCSMESDVWARICRAYLGSN